MSGSLLREIGEKSVSVAEAVPWALPRGDPGLSSPGAGAAAVGESQWPW